MNFDDLAKYLITTGQAPLWLKAYFTPDLSEELIRLALILDVLAYKRDSWSLPIFRRPVGDNERSRLTDLAIGFDTYLRRILNEH
jgi:hypothetical protein